MCHSLKASWVPKFSCKPPFSQLRYSKHNKYVLFLVSNTTAVQIKV